MEIALSLPRIVLSPGAIARLPEELAALGLQRPLVVSDAGLVALGYVARVTALLGADAALFAEVPENPTIVGVDAALKAYNSNGCDSVIALGGGSVIDTAKMVAVIAGQGGAVTDYLGVPGKVSAATKPIVVVPTTAGTGSDGSPDAGIHPDANSVSSGITSQFVVPRLALLDPELTRTLPPSLTAATGLDAISHCVEGYLARGDNPLADALALDGLARAWRWIEVATQDGENLEARAHMMLAAFEGGIAIAKGLGPGHAIAISCGDQGLHHGKLSALGVLAIAEKMREKLSLRFEALGRAAGIDLSMSFGAALRALMRDLGMPLTLKEAGYRMTSIDVLARKCSESHFNFTAGYRPGADEYREMLEGIAR